MINNSWYVQYDYRTFEILQKNDFQQRMFKVSEMFVSAPSCQQIGQQDISEWIQIVGITVKEISQLLYNFFYVEQKLTNNLIAKQVYLQIHTTFEIQKLYAGYFFTSNQRFRTNRILASSLRIIRYIEQIDHKVSSIKKNLDRTFLDNLEQVYLFIQQKIKETLQQTQNLGNHDVNVIMLDILCLLLRISGDSTMHPILNCKKQQNIMNYIQKSNQLYEEFKEQKIRAQKQFQKHKYYQGQQIFQEDINNKKIRTPSDYDYE